MTPPAAVVTDISWRRPRNRSLLIGGSPLSLLRFSGATVPHLDALEWGCTAPDDRLVRLLLRRGIVHPVVSSADGRADLVADLTVVIPTLLRTAADRDRLTALISSLAPLQVVVVDDASPVAPFVPSDSAPRCGVIRRVTTGGPAAARNAALGEISTRLVAFLDDDVAADANLVLAVSGHLDDPEVVLAAPRLVSPSPSGSGILARYEAISSPLDMGPRRALVRRGGRLSHLPGALLVARASALRAVGGFDESLRFGEDVDLLWRLADEGRCVYDPTLVASHQPRPTLRAMVRQRFGYGLSAAPLARRHRHLAYDGHLLATVALVTFALGWWRIGVGVAMLSVAQICLRLARKGVDPVTAVGLAGRGHIASARHLARAVSREWLPLAMVTAAVSWRGSLALAGAVGLPAAVDWFRGLRSGRATDPVSFVAIRCLDCAAYAGGVWTGMFRDHSPAAIRASVRLSR